MALHFLTTFFDVVNAHLCPLLSLKDRFSLSLIHPLVYLKLFQKNQALYMMRQVWALKFLSLQDKVQDLFKMGNLDCVEYLITETDWCTDVALYISIACEKGHEHVLKLLLSRVCPSENEAIELHKTFIHVVVGLMQSKHLDMALRFFKNDKQVWPSYYTMFNSEDMYHCWKYAVQHGLVKLDEEMCPLFVKEAEKPRLPSTRLLLAAESLKPHVFDLYWDKMADRKEERRTAADHSRMSFIIHQLQGRPHHDKRVVMAAHIADRLSSDEN